MAVSSSACSCQGADTAQYILSGMSTSVAAPPAAPDAATAESPSQSQPITAPSTAPPAAPPVACAPPIVTVIELDSDDEMQGEPEKAMDEEDDEDEKIVRRALQNGKMACRTSE